MTLTWTHGEQPLTVFDGMAVLDRYADDFTRDLGFDLVHKLHRFDDAQRVTESHIGTGVDVGRSIRRRSPIKRAHHGRFDAWDRNLSEHSGHVRHGQ